MSRDTNGALLTQIVGNHCGIGCQKQVSSHQQFPLRSCYYNLTLVFMLRNINLKEELQRQRTLRQHPGAMRFVYAMFDTLNEEVYHEHLIQQTLDTPNPDGVGTYPKSISTESVYTEVEIARVCVKYRLRFLDTAQFTAPMPYEAVRRIKQLQVQTGHTFNSFRIVAPAEAFHLPDCKEDPLLFAELGHGRYTLIYQWGQDLHPLRALRFFPWRTKRSLALTVAVCAMVGTALVPVGMAASHAGDASISAQLAFSAWAFTGISAATAFVLMRRFKGFSSDVWKRPFS